MSMETVFGGGKKETQQRTSVIPRLPAVIPRIGTEAGSFIRATPTLGTGGQVGTIRSAGADTPITSAGDLTGLGIDIGLAPGIGELREEALTGRRELLGDVRGDIERLRGMENPFMRARVSPFVEARGAAAREASRRGVGGPLAALATNPFDRQIAEQQALAAFDTAGAIRSGQEAIRGLLSDVSGAGQAMMEEELALLGLGQQQIRDIIASQLERQVVSETQAKERRRRGVTEGVGDIMGAFFPGGATKSGTLF